MIKKFSFLCVLLFALNAFAVSMGERRGTTAPKGLEDNMPRLVHYLTDNMFDKTEQAKAIAVWIASNISYDHDTFDRGNIKRRTSWEEQSAEQVLKNKIGVCTGFADLYEKMLALAHIKSEKVYGYTIEAPTQTMAKIKVKKENIGHVWTKVHIPGRLPLYVDTTWMSRGRFNISQRRHSEQTRRREIRQNRREHKSHSYEMDYFDFSYADLMRQGEFRFTPQRQLIKR